MKRKINLSICFCLLCLLTACRTENNTLSPADAFDNSKAALFPDFLVGIWQADVSKNSQWGFKFESDGSIPKIIHSLGGPMTLADGGVHKTGCIEGTHTVFIPGRCTSHYDPATKILTVKIELDYYEMKLPNGTLTGHCEDIFEGPVFPGSDTWHAEWKNYTWLDGASEPPKDIIDANPIELTFKKLNILDAPKL